MLLNHDPFDTFRALERLTGAARNQTASGMPMDAYRAGDHFVASFDLPGVDPGSIDVSVEGNALTVTAARTAPSGDGDYLVAERPRGRYSRQLVLGRDLDTDRLHASYTARAVSWLRQVWSVPVHSTASMYGSRSVTGSCGKR